LAGRRVCSQRADGLDGNLLRWRGLTNSDCYCNSNSYCHAYGHANTDGNANGYCNSYSYCNSNSDRNAHADGNINPMYGEVFTHTKASANSGAAPVVARGADLSAVVPRLRDEGG